MKKALIIILSILIIGVGVFIGARYLLDLKDAEDIYAWANSKYTVKDLSDQKPVIVLDSDEEAEELITSTLITEEEFENSREEDEDPEDSITYSYRYDGPWEDQIDIDLKNLIAQYPEVRGWIFFENEDISYPIVQGLDDEKYMNMSYTGEETSSGSIYMEALNMPDFSDAHTIIYGHNMKNRTMFGALRNYVNQPKYYDYHKYFQILTLDAQGHVHKSRYKVFAYGKTKSFSKVYTVCRAHDESFSEVLQYIQGNATVSTDVPVYTTDSIVTLSTCSLGETRLAVSAVKVNEVVK